MIPLVEYFLRQGHSVSVYTLDVSVDNVCRFNGKSLKVYCGKFRKKHRMRDFMRFERDQLRMFIEEDEPDIVSAHWTYEYAYAAIASGRPCVITVRDWAPKIFLLMKSLYRLGRLLMDQNVKYRGKVFIANSLYTMDKMRKYVSGDLKEVILIANALSEKYFLKIPQKVLNLKTRG